MRVLQIGKYYHPHRGGIETHLRQLSTGLLSSAKVSVLVAGKVKPGPEEIDGIEIERLSAIINPFGAPVCPAMIERLRRSNADLVHVHLPNPWAAIAYLISGCRIPLVVTYHSDIIRQSLIEPAIRPLHAKFLRRASAIISTSRDLIKHSKTLLRFQDRCVVIPFGADLAKLGKANSATVAAIREKYQGPIVLTVGRLVTYKGFEYLIRAMAQVDASLIVIGKGPLKQRLLRTAAALGVASRVAILDDVDDAVPYFHASDIFVLPSISRNEAFGIVQIEAMAAGKPIVNTRLASGVPSVSLHGVTGLTVPPADAAALTSAINQLIRDPALRSHYGSNARRRALTEFSLEAMITRTLDLYKRVIRPQNELPAEPLLHQATAGD